MLRSEPLLRALAVPAGVEKVGTPADAFLFCARPDQVIERGPAAGTRSPRSTVMSVIICVPS